LNNTLNTKQEYKQQIKENNMKPIIGITSGSSGDESGLRATLSEAYINAIKRAGGIPLIVPYCILADDADEYITRLDGVLFSGGADISPHLYDEEPVREVASFSSVRDAGEFALIRAAGSQRKPVFGICRGCEVLNVALGGSLFQDIPTQIPESIGHYPAKILFDELYHNVSILSGESRMASIFKLPAIRTNSFHHQSVKQLAPGLRVTAVAKDGVIEAYEGTDPAWYVHSVQFHPEGLFGKHQEFLGLFTDFITACNRSP
jgi:putative glutamine amidotransferase